MVRIVLFHSILGLRDAERAIADRFREAGHSVLLPDLYAGRTAGTYAAGFALRDEIGAETVDGRARDALGEASADAVLAGVSAGAARIGRLWRDRPGTRGALLLCGPADWAGLPRPDLPVAVHLARPDPFEDEAVLDAWAADARASSALAVHRYDGVGHFFLDPALPDYHAGAAELCLERCLAFLASA